MKEKKYIPTEAEKAFEKDLFENMESVFGDNITISKEERRIRLRSIAKELTDLDYNSRIIADFILPADDLIDFIRVYSDWGGNINRVNYSAFLLNKYYPNEFNIALEEKINNEEYEDAALYTELMKIVDMPNTKI